MRIRHRPFVVRSMRTASAATLVLGTLTSLAAATATAAVPAATRVAAAAATETVVLPSSGSVKVYWRGNGHGHGMSQYGAYGAALKGLSTKQILGFYYPHTTLTTLKNSTIRVHISAASANTTVLPGSGLKVTTLGTLPTKGYSQFRLVPSAGGLKVQGLTSKKPASKNTWKTLKAGLPARADFSNSKRGWVQLLLSGGSSTRYRGTIGAVRSSGGEVTVNRVSLNLYAEGVAPREMPASWSIAAERAQAIAARTYAKSSMDEADGSDAYDICDTTSCQVYGGMAHYSSGGSLLYSDFPASIAGYANAVLTYHGSAIFAQYSASNGGATVAGGKPYLVGKNDPYDTAASGDPYLDQSKSISVASIANDYGLKKATSIQITKRDGNGPWGGRVISAYVNGTTSSGHAAHIATSGFDLGDNVGVYTDYLRIVSASQPPSAVGAANATPRDAGAVVSWRAPTSAGSSPITGYQLNFAGHVLRVPKTARSTWVGPLNNLAPTTVAVRAVNAAGLSAPATLHVSAKAAPQRLVALTPKRLLDTRSKHVSITAAHPYAFAVPGQGDVPAHGALSVQLAVTITAPSASGALRVASNGVAAEPGASVAYRKGHTSTATVSVPLLPSGTVVFTPSAGQVQVIVDQESYGESAPSGSLLNAIPRAPLKTISKVATTAGTLVSLDGKPGITAATTGVVLSIDATSTKANWLRIWPDGTPAPTASQVSVGPDSSGANTVIVPLSAAHKFRIGAGASGVTAHLALVGVLGTTGGQLETFPATALIGNAGKPVAGTAVSVPMLGAAQVPKSGVRAVLLQITVHSAGQTGSLWVFPATTTTKPSAPSVEFAGKGPVTATVLVRVRKAGAVKLVSSDPRVPVSIDSIGYITSS